jgi:transcriptional regulator with XRE-family HTH domain
VDLLKITGERIKVLVGRRGYASIELFAHENSIAKSTLSEILSGKNDPKLTTLAKICAGLEIPLSELLRDADIDTWVREEAPKYDPRAPKSKSGKSGKKSGRKGG